MIVMKKKRKKVQNQLQEKLGDLISEIEQIINDEDNENPNQSFLDNLDFAIQYLQEALEDLETN